MKLEKMNNELTKVKRDLTNKLEGNFNSIKEFNQQINFYWIAATSEVLNTTVKNLVKTNAELNNAKRDLTDKLEGCEIFWLN